MSIPAHRLTARNAYRQAAEVSAFAQDHVYPLDATVYGVTATTGGTVTHLPAMAAHSCAVSTASGSRAVLRSHRRPRAANGRARCTLVTGYVTKLVENQIKRIGSFDDNNGAYFEVDGETLYAVRRSDASGTLESTRVANSVWNANKETVNTLVSHVWEIREAWPNGDVSYFVDGVLVHVISGGGAFTGPAWRSARLPVSVEVVNSAAASSAGAFVCTSMAVDVEEFPPAQRSFGAYSADATVSATPQIMLAIQPAAAFGGQTNDVEILPTMLSLSSSAACRVQVVLGTVISGGSFTAPDAESASEVNVTASAPNGGSVVAELVFSGNASLDLADIVGPLCLNADGTQTNLAIVAQALSGSIEVRAALTWKETR